MAIMNPNEINRREKELIKKKLDKISYPFINDDNCEYYYETELVRRNLDRTREDYISRSKGFIISKPQKTTKKDMKDPFSIYSSKFGQTLADLNPFADRHRCECRNLEGRKFIGETCPQCGTVVKYVGDDYDYFGFFALKDPYYIIHPNLYNSLEFYIGKKEFPAILEYKKEKDIDGHNIENAEIDEKAPFKGIGMMEFKNRFDEIIEFYHNVNKGKKEEYYRDIIEHRDIIFTQTSVCFSTLLRPYQINGKGFSFEETNATYNMMAKLVAKINTTKLRINRKSKQKNQLLWDLQCKQQELYKELENILSGKKGVVRQLLGGRYQFTSRDVIVPDKTLRLDEISLPYVALVELLQQTIINLLRKVYNLSANSAYNIWYLAKTEPDQRVVSIIENLIEKRKIHVLINRN